MVMIAGVNIAKDTLTPLIGEPIDPSIYQEITEFVEKYVHQGTKIVLTGRIQTGSYTNKDNIKVYTTEVIAEDIEFAESKATAEGSGGAGGHQKPDQTENDGFMNIPEGIDEELPFN